MHPVSRFLEASVALALLVAALPIGAAIALAIRLVSGSPVLHRGSRLGRHKRPFVMYKFRTLRVGADTVLRGALVSPMHGVSNRLGTFLRQTRLDELPQLVNILRGDMAFVGPRPLRQEVYEAQCQGIPGFDRRFDVRPGLVGYAQVFTPHGSPKRCRALVDHLITLRQRSFAQDARLLALVVFMTARQVAGAGLQAIARWRAARRRLDRRRLSRRQLKPGYVAVWTGGFGPAALAGFVLDIDERALRVRRGSAPASGGVVELAVRVGHGADGPRMRRARCRLDVVETRAARGGLDTVYRYHPLTANSLYVVEQYLLQNSFVPRRAE